MPHSDIAGALNARTTVRIAYSRSTDAHHIAVVRGGEVIRELATIHNGYDDEAAEALAEAIAAGVARKRGLDVTRIDTD